ncbi:hypothetical protein [Acinetobacter sp. ANC 4648]|uniref:hypothetical protein n=1 Tax=Acinetobacter sp. ANC 4648 TaxID=1977875 RepID=UPI000A351F0E|nr:hypothetical protein [Acinetobacter sp. ANC 4648]OTG83834.1 hypothetical protein B9T27_04880 [Acinetobacter sp. ANC 4648]
MTTPDYTVKFKKTVLASFIGLCLNQSCFALEALSDENLSDTTGEGIAILPQDAFMVFRGAGANESEDNILTDRTKDSGYIHYIPVGPLSSFVQDTNKDGKVNTLDHSVGKADLYMYGLAVSKNTNNDTNSRLDSGKNAQGLANAAIKSWGTAANPWIFKVDTDLNVPNFLTGSDCLGSASSGCAAAGYNNSVTYLNLEAPLYDLVTPITPETGSDAYKLKLALWADAFVRDQSKVDGDPNQFRLGELFSTTAPSVADPNLDRANRIRLQAIWNNFSINGSRIQMFQTLGGATNTGGMSSFYNNTLGLAGVLRFNSGAASVSGVTLNNGVVSGLATGGFAAQYKNATATRAQTTTNRYSTLWPGQVSYTAGTGAFTVIPSDFNNRIYQLRTIDTVDTITEGYYNLPTTGMNNVLRLSTQESATSPQGLLSTPALGNGAAPTFDSNEGIFIYNLNTNLVLGSLYQPLTVGSDGKNFSLEVARIPNKESIYKKIYTDYTGADKTYLGSTCNVYQCGSNGLAGYQGNNATHSSISIGSTIYDKQNNALQAFKGDSGYDAIGISFGALKGNSIQASTKYYSQLQAKMRDYISLTGAGSRNTWRYATGVSAGPIDITGTSFSNPSFVTSWATGTAGCNEGTGNSNTCFDFDKGSWFDINSFDVPDAATSSTVTIGGKQVVLPNYNPTVAHAGYVVGKGAPTGYDWSGNGRSFTVDAWGALPNANYSGTKWTSTSAAPTIAPTVSNAIPMNNMGSAVIDGLLIQHMKITTTGL